MIIWIIGIAATIALCFSITAGLAVYRIKRNHSDLISKIEAHELVLKTLTKTNRNVQHQLVELHAANHSLVEQLNKLGLLVEQTASRQSDIESHDPDNKLYTRAVKMVELGADLDEVMRECELPKAEAELLFTLHGKRA